VFSYPRGIILQGTNLSQLYGLGGFWNTFFAETSTIEGSLAVGAYQAGLIYSELLQNISPLALGTTQRYLNKEISLVVLPADSNTLPDNLVGARYIVDRPYLPSLILENGVDFTIVGNELIFANGQTAADFPLASSVTPSGTQYSLWFVDAAYDEGWLQKYYGALLGQPSSSASSDTFKAFLDGVLFTQINGPNVAILNAGLQLALGLPLALYDETVLTTYTEAGQYVVVTNKTAYSISAGLNLVVQPGTSYTVGEPIFYTAARVVDYQVQDKWWLGLTIPEQIIPNPPERPLAIPGNWVDQLMSSTLKTHTFLVRIATSISNVVEFSTLLRSIIPTYTYPLVFSLVPYTEIFNYSDSVSLTLTPGVCEKVYQPSQFLRNTSAYSRSCPKFQRFNIINTIANRDLAQSPQLQDFAETGSNASSVFFPMQKAGLSEVETSYAGAIFGPRNMATPRTRSSYTPLRGPTQPQAVNPFGPIIPLYLTKAWYLNQYITLTGWETVVDYGDVPFPTEEIYLNAYTPREAYLNFIQPTNVPPGSLLYIYNLIDDLYSVNLRIPDEELNLQGVLDNFVFGYVVEDPDTNLSYLADVPFYRGAAQAFNNPIYFSRDRNVEQYSDSLNSPIPYNRNGMTLRGSNK
jgi:hypothetical protein